ncbi:zona pellucida sperm-binding protein 3-like [Takifugu flavidus]|uniref:Zona pellucida sperm-binding protein 3 n=1 Tax=Takifugu flavidus TaxID=433684 RepID=A0A5C6NAP5_9TELE|nr:zona pellucida sperm-binding protein 3-like [Takifugu flavidus]TWW64175.1 Zona pellucida sperm-binding protein 3 [Takifugu flavidus]
MGSRVVVSIGIVFLIAGGKTWAAAKTQISARAKETLNQTWADGEVAGPRPRARINYQLRIYQLRRPDTEKEKQQPPQRPEEAGGGPEQLGIEKPVHRLIPIQGPDLNPHFEPETRVMVIADHRVPVPAASVAAHCGEGEVAVEVNQNLFGNGQLIYPSDLTLGGCVAQSTTDHILLFQTELHGCNSMLNMTEDALIYSFSLEYLPTPIGNTFILKTNPAEVVIECHYQRRHYVSSNALRPAWVLFAAMMEAEQQPQFSLRLMTEDWQSPRPSNVFFLSDVIHFEAVLLGYHVPLRIYVDSCVATVTPDPDSQPRYPFIDNFGCLRDSRLTGAKSFFLQRSQEDKIQFQLETFRFHQDHNNSVHITCQLKATSVSGPIDSQHKSCSFLTEANRWVASDGDNMVCRCCETSCGEQRRKRRSAVDAGFPPHTQWEGRASLGVILLEEDTQELPQEPAPQSPTASSSSMAFLCGAGATIAFVLLALVGAVVCSRTSKPTAYTVCS